jgi:hypothetical protein
VTDSLTLITYVLGGTAALFLLLAVVRWWGRRERPDAAEIERRRRSHVNRIGRIADGRIVELMDQLAPDKAEQLLAYTYRVRGVEYQAAQDVSGLRGRINFQQVAAGHSTQVKYDPRNPTNSIVLCEEWSGL